MKKRVMKMKECSEWAFECREVFPSFDKFSIEADYAKTPKKALGRVKGIVKVAQDFDAIELLLTDAKTFSVGMRQERNINKRFS